MGQFVKFCIVGLSSTAVYYILYFLFVYLGAHYIIASVFGFIFSVLNSFFWNNRFVFRNETTQKRNVFNALVKTYISYIFTGLVLQNALLFLFIEILQISKYIAPFFCVIITVPLNFLFNKKWTFKPVKIN